MVISKVQRFTKMKWAENSKEEKPSIGLLGMLRWGEQMSSQQVQHITSPSTYEEVDITCLLQTRRINYERLLSPIGELRHEQRLRLLHVGRYVSVYVAQRAQPELWTEWMHNAAPVSHSPSIRRERQVEQAIKAHPTTDAPNMMRFLWQVRDGLATPKELNCSKQSEV